MEAVAPTQTTRCCIAGGGPAGMMLGFLLARAGVEVAVLEKHADFLRDFRGDTVHPSTLEVLHELGLLDEFLRRPHQEVREVAVMIAGRRFAVADFSHVPTHARFLAFMPQWDFLDFLAEHARKLPSFALHLRTEAVGLVEDGGRVAGVRAVGPDGPVEVRADLVVVAEGRHSALRSAAGLEVQDLGAPMDVLWLRLSREPDDPREVLGNIAQGRVFVMLDRGDYWQCAFVIPKGALAELARGEIAWLRDQIAALVPFLRDRVAEIRSWDDAKLLTVKVDRLREWWRPGLLCIGDAAHAMSPVGGVGINLAIQDAVAAANLLAPALRRGAPTPDELRAVQRRRELPTRITQAAQLFVQDRVIAPTLAGATPRAPLPLRWLDAWPLLRRIPARAIGLGVRPEHVRT
jgi:2-polyprenyl-6-methoxyphenol hydroxylase-like FAD-dependent oxidoreductase